MRVETTEPEVPVRLIVGHLEPAEIGTLRPPFTPLHVADLLEQAANEIRENYALEVC